MQMSAMDEDMQSVDIVDDVVNNVNPATVAMQAQIDALTQRLEALVQASPNSAAGPSTSTAAPPAAAPSVDLNAIMAMMAAFMAQHSAPKPAAARLQPGKLSLDFPKTGAMTGMVEELES